MSAQIIAQVIEFSNYFPIIFSRNLEISNSFLDWNYHVLKPYEDCFSINPILPGPELEIDELEYNRILIEILSMCLELSPFNELLVRILLGKIKNKIKIPSLTDLFGEIYEFALKNNDWDDGDEILDKFDDLVWGEWFFLCGTPFETLNVENFFWQPIIISFERLTNAMEQLLLNIFITRILHSKIKRVVALVVSNACNLTDIVTYKIIKDQEKLGLKIFMEEYPSNLSNELVRECGTIIWFKKEELYELDILRKFGFNNDQIRYIAKMSYGDFVVKFPCLANPFPAKL